VTDASRIHAEVHEIDRAATKEFWDYRASLVGKVSEWSLTMFQDDKPELAEARDRFEKETILGFLNLASTTRVLDIGCGTGRWGVELVDKVQSYLGFDFSEAIIDIAKADFAAHGAPESFRLQTLPVSDMAPDALLSGGPFDLFIVAGVFLYLNDDEVATGFEQIAAMAAPGARLYVREPVGVDHRLTLDRHFSKDFGRDYSAVYRDRNFYEKLIATYLEPAGFEVTTAEWLYPDTLSNRAETAQHFWIVERRA
jgi:cyclopropane fatty-acyl-phospholipid synthase-like methyltransferase